MSTRALLARVTRLEQARVAPWERWVGTPEQFAADCQRGVDEGRYDRRDMPAVAAAVSRWTTELLWQ